MMIELGQHYTIAETQMALRAVKHNGVVTLKDLKASYEWGILCPDGSLHKGEYLEGYTVVGELLKPIRHYVSNGRQRPSKADHEHRETLSIKLLYPCDVETVTFDLNGDM